MEAMLRIAFLLLPTLVLLAIPLSLVYTSPKRQPPRLLKLSVAIVLYGVLIAAEWYGGLAHHYCLRIDWRDIVFWPFILLWRQSDTLMRDMTTLKSLLNMLCTAILLAPFFLIGWGVFRKQGHWLPFILSGVLILFLMGFGYAVRGA